MGRIFLCGHTGSENRGCEAIIRATASLLKECGCTQIIAMTRDPDYDKKLKLDEAVSLMPYPKRPFPVRVIAYLRRKLLKDDLWGAKYDNAALFRNIRQGDILFNVGGDTYCYGVPTLSYAMNEMAQVRGIPTVFWGCSVDRRILEDPRMQKDVNRYSCILTREKMTRDLLLQVVTEKSKVRLACDPAFWLEARPIELPANFQPGNTLGLNISPLVLGKDSSVETAVLNNVYYLIDRVLEQTDMSVCLIPHVYDPERNTQDIRVLRKIYERYADNGRVMLIQEERSCTELKYVISRCRFFVGARTHPVIAAYSTGVPALALSYSVKSLGIAGDVLGQTQPYTVSWKNLQKEEQLWQHFRDGVMKQETEILDRYARCMPEYKASIQKELTKILRG